MRSPSEQMTTRWARLEPVHTDETRDRLRRLARHLSAFEAPGFSFGSWMPARKRDDGVIVMGWYEPGPEADAFLADARALITPFDWPAWASASEGQSLLGHPEAVGSASADDLRKLLTVYVRSERFGDGTLEAAFASGMLTAIIRRAGVLAAELDRTPARGT
jgi:hypothetical protein